MLPELVRGFKQRMKKWIIYEGSLRPCLYPHPFFRLLNHQRPPALRSVVVGRIGTLTGVSASVTPPTVGDARLRPSPPPPTVPQFAQRTQSEEVSFSRVFLAFLDPFFSDLLAFFQRCGYCDSTSGIRCPKPAGYLKVGTLRTQFLMLCSRTPLTHVSKELRLSTSLDILNCQRGMRIN